MYGLLPKERVVLYAILPELFAAIVAVHVEANGAGTSTAIVRSQLNIEPFPLVCDLLDMKPADKSSTVTANYIHGIIRDLHCKNYTNCQLCTTKPIS